MISIFKEGFSDMKLYAIFPTSKLAATLLTERHQDKENN